jgi:hypothetical protein
MPSNGKRTERGTGRRKRVGKEKKRKEKKG